MQNRNDIKDIAPNPGSGHIPSLLESLWERSQDRLWIGYAGMSRSIRVTSKAGIRPEGAAHRAGKSFFSSLLSGLSAVTLVHEHTRRPRSYKSDGLRGDWNAIGNDIRAAMQKVNDAER